MGKQPALWSLSVAPGVGARTRASHGCLANFLWADFLRRRVERKLVEKNFDKALEQAVQLAKAQLVF
jgi:hypothetical protein